MWNECIKIKNVTKVVLLDVPYTASPDIIQILVIVGLSFISELGKVFKSFLCYQFMLQNVERQLTFA